MKEVISWIMENSNALLATIGATLAAVAMICKFTPTPKDDAIVAKLLKWLNLLPKSK